MNVYTYYGETVFDPKEQQDLIHLWKQSWSKHGFTPVILGQDDLRKSEKADLLYNKAMDLPTVNIKKYEVNCFVRYAAVEAQGGGIMTDYDVMNYGFTPTDLEKLDAHIPNFGHGIQNSPAVCPCVVYGNKDTFNRIIDIFLAYKTSKDWDQHDGRPHTSDQHVLIRELNQNNKMEFKILFDHFRNYRDVDWLTASLVHYCNAAMQRKNRANDIPGLRAM